MEPTQESSEAHNLPYPSEDHKGADHSEKLHTSPGAKTEGTMRAVFIEDFDQPLVVREIPIPKPASGEVLIKVEAGPINPLDLGFLKGTYAKKEQLPCRGGFEGSGTVIASGGGLIARSLVGKKVAFGVEAGKSGTWGEYAVAPALMCIAVDKHISFEHAACGTINPFTAMILVEIVKREKAKAVVLQAAASQLGRMLVRVLKKEGIKTITIVRRQEQKKILEELGADAVIISQDKDFEEQLRKKAAELHANILLECVCGDVTVKTIRAMPKDSEVYVYGHLSDDALTDVDFGDLLTMNKTIKPFNVLVWMSKQWMFTKIGMLKKTQKLLATDLKSDISKTFSIDEVNEAIKYYKTHMTEGKVLIKSHTETKSQ